MFLWQELQDCFEKQDIPMLQQVIATMNQEEAAYHMKRCVDSGLWLPEGGKKNAEGAETAEAGESSGTSGPDKPPEEPTYQAISDLD